LTCMPHLWQEPYFSPFLTYLDLSVNHTNSVSSFGDVVHSDIWLSPDALDSQRKSLISEMKCLQYFNRRQIFVERPFLKE
jgi:hypothetical protein